MTCLFKYSARAFSTLTKQISTSNLVVYSKSACPYCVRAKYLLDIKGINYNEVVVDYDRNEDEIREDLQQFSTHRGFPSIFLQGEHIGSFDELKDLSESGRLD